MNLILKLEKKDIKTVKYGLNTAIEGEFVTVIFDDDALEEFLNDVAMIKETERLKKTTTPTDAMMQL